MDRIAVSYYILCTMQSIKQRGAGTRCDRGLESGLNKKNNRDTREHSINDDRIN
jgi:hypothetical protein